MAATNGSIHAATNGHAIKKDTKDGASKRRRSGTVKRRGFVSWTLSTIARYVMDCWLRDTASARALLTMTR